MITLELIDLHISPAALYAAVALLSNTMPTPSFLVTTSLSVGAGLPECSTIHPSAAGHSKPFGLLNSSY